MVMADSPTTKLRLTTENHNTFLSALHDMGALREEDPEMQGELSIL
jgi:hypothetical protein